MKGLVIVFIVIITMCILPAGFGACLCRYNSVGCNDDSAQRQCNRAASEIANYNEWFMRWAFQIVSLDPRIISDDNVFLTKLSDSLKNCSLSDCSKGLYTLTNLGQLGGNGRADVVTCISVPLINECERLRNDVQPCHLDMLHHLRDAGVEEYRLDQVSTHLYGLRAPHIVCGENLETFLTSSKSSTNHVDVIVLTIAIIGMIVSF